MTEQVEKTEIRVERPPLAAASVRANYTERQALRASVKAVFYAIALVAVLAALAVLSLLPRERV